MIFRTKEDAQQFLIEINKIGQVHLVRDREYKPTDEEMHSFIKSRGSIIPKLKSFRKSQDGKNNWRQNRYSMMAGIKKWHNSTDGKRFHRALGRYNATHSYDRDKKQEESLLDCFTEAQEAKKALSSLLTHMYIELDFYHPLDEQIDLEILIEEARPAIRRLEEKLDNPFFEFKDEDRNDLDVILRLIDPKTLMVELAHYLDQDIEEVEKFFESYLSCSDIYECGAYLTCLDKTREHFEAE